MIQTIKFYSKLSLFSIREEQSSLSATLAGFMLYPAFIWIFSKLWLGLNNNISTLEPAELFAYIGLTEILFMTSLREPFIDRASSDFALSFVRPRLWPLYTSISIYSRTLFRRVIYLLIFVLILPLFTNNFELIWYSAIKFILFIPIVTVLESLYSFLLTCLQIRFYTIRNFRMLFGKLFLIFGGVLAPLSDLPSSWQTILLNTPFTDLIFQVSYFSIKGEFYQLTILQWLVRIFIQFVCVIVISYWFYKDSRQHYHNFGG